MRSDSLRCSDASRRAYPGTITVLYDAFGKSSDMHKDWGYAALVEYGRKRILFGTGNNPDVRVWPRFIYAAFIRGSADDVVDKALNYVFSNDRAFQESLKMP